MSDTNTPTSALNRRWKILDVKLEYSIDGPVTGTLHLSSRSNSVIASIVLTKTERFWLDRILYSVLKRDEIGV
jgi:hypothetical protein